jgi:hypothetical protein
MSFFLPSIAFCSLSLSNQNAKEIHSTNRCKLVCPLSIISMNLLNCDPYVKHEKCQGNDLPWVAASNLLGFKISKSFPSAYFTWALAWTTQAPFFSSRLASRFIEEKSTRSGSSKWKGFRSRIRAEQGGLSNSKANERFRLIFERLTCAKRRLLFRNRWSGASSA